MKNVQILFGKMTKRYYWVVPESPRWLLSRDRIDEAETIVQRIAHINKRSIPANYLRSLQQVIMLLYFYRISLPSPFAL